MNPKAEAERVLGLVPTTLATEPELYDRRRVVLSLRLRKMSEAAMEFTSLQKKAQDRRISPMFVARRRARPATRARWRSRCGDQPSEHRQGGCGGLSPPPLKRRLFTGRAIRPVSETEVKACQPKEPP